jgi:predicted DNA-binding protein (MmcQ/YjbR family)
MTVEELRAISLKLPGVTEDIKWEDHLCFSVGDKMFLVTNPDQVPSSASFKVTEEDFHEVISRDGFAKHTYLGRHHWVQLDDINRLKKKEWESYIRQSYELVAAKLSKKIQKQLGLL